MFRELLLASYRSSSRKLRQSLLRRRQFDTKFSSFGSHRESATRDSADLLTTLALNAVALCLFPSEVDAKGSRLQDGQAVRKEVS